MDIQTERLYIRKLTHNDTDDYYRIFGSPGAAKYDDFDPISSEEALEDIKAIIRGYSEDADEKEYAAELKEAGRVIGVLNVLRKDGFIFIGYHFNESYHGRGYAAEAVKALVSYLESSGSREVRAVVDPENAPSIRLLEKLGFELFDKNILQDPEEKKYIELVYRHKRRPV